LIRNKDVAAARDILRFCERDAAFTVGKLLDSAVANAVNNDGMEAEDLYVSACFADEGTTVKRWRPRARGRATRIRKRTCHITVIVSRLPDDELRDRRTRQPGAADRRRRVAGGRKRASTRTEAAPTEDVVAHEDLPFTEGADVEEIEELAGQEVEGVEVAPATGDEPEAEAAAEPDAEREAEAADDKEQDK